MRSSKSLNLGNNSDFVHLFNEKEFDKDSPYLNENNNSSQRSASISLLRQEYLNRPEYLATSLQSGEQVILTALPTPLSSQRKLLTDSLGSLYNRNPSFTSSYARHRKTEDESGLSCGSSWCLGFLVLIAQILLNGVMALVLYWVMVFYSVEKNGQTYYFAWYGQDEYNTKLGFNYHPVLMIAGFIYLAGQAMLLYRSCRCCRRIWNKLLHATFHLLAIPCIVIGFIAVLDSHNYKTSLNSLGQEILDPIPNFYSLHSWMGLLAMGLFGLQYVAGFFSFLLLLCCESGTASFRASMVPIHSAFGISSFVIAIGTACTGLTEKAFFALSVAYSQWVPYLSDPDFDASNALGNLKTLGSKYTHDMFHQSIVINTLAISMVVLCIVMILLVSHPKFRSRPNGNTTVTVTHDRYG